MTDSVVKKYYVYHAYSKYGELLYVGKGTGDRYRHCLNGASHVKELNRFFFNNGENGSIEVRIVRYFDNSEDALHSESCDIETLKPTFNVVGNKNKALRGFVKKLSLVEKINLNVYIPMSTLIKGYHNAMINNDELTVSTVDLYAPMISENFSKIGYEAIVEANFNKTRISKLYLRSPPKVQVRDSDMIKQEDLVEELDIEEVRSRLEIVEKEVKDARKVKLYAIYTSKKDVKIAEMACEIGVSVRTVKYWLKELRNTGFIE